MNDLFSESFSRARDEFHSIDMTNAVASNDPTTSLDKFFQDVEAIKAELRALESLYAQLQASHEHSKTIHSAKTVKKLRSTMDADISNSLKKAKLIKILLQALESSNDSNRALPDCGPGSASDRIRTSTVNSLGKKLHGYMNAFNSLRQRIGSEYRETVQRRYYTITGENADEKVLERLIETGEGETFIQKAIEKQRRAEVMDVVMEIHERHDAVREIERSLRELHQIFMDMHVLVQSQGDMLDDIESQVNRANSFVRRGVEGLVVAKKTQKNSRKWACFGILILLIVALIIVLSLRPWKW